MLQLNNKTPFAASFVLLPDEEGIDTLYIMVRADFNIGRGWTLSEPQKPPQETDEYWGEPGESSLKYASDFHPGKKATDIVMLGYACAPNEQAVTQLDVQLTAGQISKTVRVFGDRQWRNGRITWPGSFSTMPIVYEKAYGGQYLDQGEVVSAEPRNPVGCGFIGNRDVHEIEGLPLPNLEDPTNLINSYHDQPTPAGFGYIDPSWQFRQQYAGSYDGQWQQQRAPFLPEDFDKCFFNAAHPDLIYPGYLQGGEAVHITHMHPKGDLGFTLPGVRLAAQIEMTRGTATPEFYLETLELYPNQLQLAMVWRATFPCDKKMLKIRKISVGLSRE